MKRHRISDSRTLLNQCGLLFVVAAALPANAQPSPAAISAFNNYVAAVESRLAQEHRSPEAFLASVSSDSRGIANLLHGELIIERLTPAQVTLPGAMLHHWRGTAFVPGATAAGFERMMRDFGSYPRRFSPQVLQAKAVTQQGDRLEASMRVQQRHVITVVMDTDYDVSFGRLDAHHGFSTSRSTRISEIASPGSASEHALTADQEHGFLWRQNTYWSYEERDGGLYMQIESVSLSRSIPTGLGWVVRPFVETVPRDSLEFTLRSTCNALGK